MPRRPGSHLPGTVRTSAAVAAAAPELTRRQLEYWVEMGWVVSQTEPARGRPRTFSDSELKVLGLMYKLCVAGFPARNAAWIARKAVERHERLPGAMTRVELVPGVVIEISF